MVVLFMGYVRMIKIKAIWQFLLSIKGFKVTGKELFWLDDHAS